MLDIKWEKIKKIYFCGIGGIGISALARYYNFLNYEILGSDINDSELLNDLQKENIKIFIGQDSENIDESIDLFIYSSAVPETNSERLKAKKLNIPQYSYNEILGELSREKYTVAISGTNGKTTTTAMTALLLENAGKDILALVGSKIPQWNSNLRFGKDDIFVVEACEYKAHMLELDPKIIVLTNLAEDHLDFYKDIDDIISYFQKYIDKLSSDDLLIFNADDPNIARLNWRKSDYRVLTFGIDNPNADISIDKHTIDKAVQDFWITFNGDKYTRVKLYVPGKFNIYNALASASVGIALGLNKEEIKNGLAVFKGTWRRFEKFLEKDSIIYISDYAHHPDAIKGTLKAAKEFYPDKRIITVFQPHQHNRTKKLFNDFIDSFIDTDILLLADIYDVKGREAEEDQDINSELLVNTIKKKYPESQIFYTADLEKTLEKIKEIREENDLIILMGAGDIDTLRYKL